MNITLKTIRENIGLTQAQVSEITGVPVKTLRNWEQEIRKPSEWTMDLVIDKILSTEVNRNVDLNDDGDDENSILSFSTIKNEVINIAKDFDISKVYLFGSYVKGDALPLSDIDLYMESDIFGLDYYGVVERFRNALHKKVDLLSNKTIVPDSRIYEEIMKTGVVIYERS